MVRKLPQPIINTDLFLAIIMPFAGFPLIIMFSILGMFLTFGLSIILADIEFWGATAFFFPLGFVGFTIPYILNIWKDLDIKQTRIMGTGLMVIVYTILLINGDLLSFIYPDVCAEALASNVTDYNFGGFC